jgi:hypothetical protein
MTSPTIPNSPVFSLAGSQAAPRVTPPPVFSDLVPLGVRIYDHTSSLDVWVTKWVDDLQYRSVVPGGFASASFRLHVPQHLYPAAAGWATRSERTPLVRLFNRVQIVDLRSSEIAWEGRIDSAARVTDDGFSWDIGCAGAMVAATDISKPVFYADSSTDWWFTRETQQSRAALFSWSRTDSPPSLKVDLKPETQWGNSDTPGGLWATYYHFLCLATGQYLGRFTVTYQTSAPSVTGGTSIKVRANVYTPATDTWQNGVDSVSLGSAETTLANAVGAGGSFTSTQAQVIDFDVIGPATDVITPTAGGGWVACTNPIVIAMRVNRNGSNLTAASNYSTNYVTVSQVVEDVLGRFLNNAWTSSVGAPLNDPAPGSVGTGRAYIDTSDTTPITDLKWPDGVTAAEILNQMMTVQTDAYWAIWESTNTATNDRDAQRFRFEWATWPASPGYMATSTDGLDEQPDGSNVYNFVFYRFQNTDFQGVSPGGSYVPPPGLQEWWDFTDPRTAPLLSDRLTRAATIKKDGITDAGTAGNLAEQWIADNGTESNAGTLTVKRPIQFYDAGLNSGSGAGRMVDPWMIRPGKLLRIVDVPPPAEMTNFNHGAAAPPATHAGAVFKVVATNYDSSDNSCRLELDQVTAWSLPGQILPTAQTNVQTILG